MILFRMKLLMLTYMILLTNELSKRLLKQMLLLTHLLKTALNIEIKRTMSIKNLILVLADLEKEILKVFQGLKTCPNI